MTIEQAFELVANLDYKESHRKYAPQHGLLHFNHSGEVVSVYRFKKTPTEIEQIDALSKHPRCVQIPTGPDFFATPEDLKTRIEKSLWLFAHMKH